MFKKFLQLLPIAGCVAFVLFLLNLIGVTQFNIVTGFITASLVTVVLGGIITILVMLTSK